MTHPNKVTRERLERLVKAIRQELVAFQISRFITEPIFGVVDVPLFGLRFKVIENALQDDSNYQVVHIVKGEDVDSDNIFLLLAGSGYLEWLREQISTMAYFKILSYNNRWELILRSARTRLLEQKKGQYLLSRIEGLQDKPLMQIYHEDPTVFDWILR